LEGDEFELLPFEPEESSLNLSVRPQNDIARNIKPNPKIDLIFLSMRSDPIKSH